MKQLLFIAFLLSIYSCAFYNDANFDGSTSGSYFPPSQGLPSEPGKCYAKSLMSDKYVLSYDTTLMYTGADSTMPGVETVVEVTPATTKWVKKKADKNCLSADPSDCLVWCLEKTPAVRRTLVTVTDTMLVKEFRIETIESKFLEKAGGFMEWREVICAEDITSRFVLDLRESLVDQGYQVDMYNDKIDNELKKVLKEFQIDNYLPIGQLDMETLDRLGL